MGHEDAELGTIKVFLADDNLIVREGVRALIERHGDLRVVGMAVLCTSSPSPGTAPP